MLYNVIYCFSFQHDETDYDIISARILHKDPEPVTSFCLNKVVPVVVIVVSEERSCVTTNVYNNKIKFIDIFVLMFTTTNKSQRDRKKQLKQQKQIYFVKLPSLKNALVNNIVGERFSLLGKKSIFNQRNISAGHIIFLFDFVSSSITMQLFIHHISHYFDAICFNCGVSSPLRCQNRHLMKTAS